MIKKAKGFTMIELVVVIGILAILAAAVVLVLNPAGVLAQGRDSQRISDLQTVKKAIYLYLATVQSPSIAVGPTCTAANCNTGGPFGSETITSSTAIDGSGWVKVNLAGASGSPLSALPLDPINSGNYFYGYKGEPVSLTFEIDARLESSKYRDLMKTDSGNKNICSTYIEPTCYYEIGTDPGLDL